MLLAIVGIVTTRAFAADCTVLTTVKINEFTVTTGAEWVELYNDSDTDVVIDGWSFVYGTNDWGTTETLPAAATIPAHGFYVIGSTGAAIKDVDAGTMDLGNAGSNADAMRLECSGTVVDTVVYGKAGKTNDGHFMDDTGAEASVYAPVPTSDHTSGRVPDGMDLANDGADWVANDPTPGAQNIEATGGDTGDTGSGTVDADCANAGSVRINEFDANTGVDWVELYTDGGDVALAGWIVEFGTSAGNTDTVELGEYTLSDKGYFVVGNTGAAYKDQEASDLDLGNASNPDFVRISCDSTVIDTVVYGKSTATNSDGWMEDDGSVATKFAPMPKSGHSSARREDGLDTNVSGADFVDSESPTPGAANPVIICVAGNNDIKLNEILYNPAGSDGDNDWVEIFNAGDSAVRIDGWAIQLATKDFATKFTFPYDTSIAAGQFMTVSGGGLSGGTFTADSFSVGNGTGGDGIRLIDCEGEAMDTVLYGAELEAGSALEGDDGSTDVVPLLDAEGYSNGRSPDGADSDDVGDWGIYSVPTPGAPNGKPAPDGDGNGKIERPGCGGGPGTADNPGGGCVTAPMPLGGFELLLLAFTLRRRKQ